MTEDKEHITSNSETYYRSQNIEWYFEALESSQEWDFQS